MLLRMIYDDRLAQAAYLIGCQRTGEAIVIDPERDVDRYVEMAKKEGLRLVAAAETHIHADFVSGVRELAERGARAYVSGEGGEEWRSRWLDKKAGGGRYDAVELRDGETFRVGNIEFRAVHTPGHTPEHLSYMVTDRGGGANEPMGIITGDFVFVGDVGRPDLLESAAGQAGAARPAAAALFRSVRKFAELPDYLQVWPAHGAGSACGKALGAVPQSTVGYEKRFNPAVLAAAEEARFVGHVLEGQPEPPLYFARMKRVNRDGPAVLGGVPAPAVVSGDEMARIASDRGAVVLDARPWKEFRAGHLKDSLFAPLDGSFPGVAGSYIPETARVFIVSDQADAVTRALIRIGIDTIAGVIRPADLAGARGLETTDEIDVPEALAWREKGAQVLDVRKADEWAAGHVPGATRAVHTRLPAAIRELSKDRPVVVHCQGGSRSARAAALLQREGFKVANLAGGWKAWEAAKAPVEK